MKHAFSKILAVVFGLLFFNKLLATDTTFLLLREDWRARVPLNKQGGFLDINQYLQYWNVITFRNATAESSPRYDAFIRRGRLGVSGRINEKVLFSAGFSYDGIGKDSLTSSAGVPNAEDNSTFMLRDVFVIWRRTTLFNVTVGYFRPRVGRENIYSSSFNISQEKGFPSYQPRFHLIGRGIGRETGINIGGIKKSKVYAVLYDFGLFDTNHPKIRGSGSVFSPLFTGRVMLMLGDPEMTEYNLVYFQSGFTKRKGLSIGANGAYQQKTNIMRNNAMFGLDMQLNWKALDCIAEYNWLYRHSLLAYNQTLFSRDGVFVIKSAWNKILKDKTILQYCLMYTGEISDKQFLGDFNPYTGAIGQRQVAAGVNWCINYDRLKVGLHYVYGIMKNKVPFEHYSYLNPSIQFMM